MTTLDQYTPEERAGMVGMWATNLAYTGDGENVGVIACVQHDRVWLIHTNNHGEWSVLSTNTVSPRPDLPRAWNPDGTPPKGEWQTAKAKIIPNENAKYDRESNTIVGDGIADPNHEPRTAHDIRCWVGEWEEI